MDPKWSKWLTVLAQTQNILDLLGGDSLPISKSVPPGNVPVKGDILDLLGDLDLSAAPQNAGRFYSQLFLGLTFFYYLAIVRP